MFSAFEKFGRLGASASAAPFSPTKLFAAGEAGGVWDFTTLANLYQDSAGTTPCTTVGQTIGLVFDTKNGTPVPTTYITDQSFDAGISEWGAQFPGSDVSATWDSVNKRMTVTRNAGGIDGRPTIAFPVVAGRAYKLDVVVTSTTGGPAFGTANSFGAANITNLGPQAISATVFSKIGYATATETTYLGLWCANNQSAQFESVQISELPGNHLTQATSTARALYKATGNAKWCDYDEIDDLHTATFASSLGSSCTVARANVGSTPTILTSQTIGTSYTSNTDTAALVIVNRALTAGETASLTAWLTAKGAT